MAFRSLHYTRGSSPSWLLGYLKQFSHHSNHLLNIWKKIHNNYILKEFTCTEKMPSQSASVTSSFWDSFWVFLIMISKFSLYLKTGETSISWEQGKENHREIPTLSRNLSWLRCFVAIKQNSQTSTFYGEDWMAKQGKVKAKCSKVKNRSKMGGKIEIFWTKISLNLGMRK